MDTFRFIDIYATKGIEYLIVIGFLVSIVFFYLYFVAERPVSAVAKESFFSILARKMHIGGLQWNPTMAYMKYPKEEKTKKTEEQKPSKAK